MQNSSKTNKRAVSIKEHVVGKIVLEIIGIGGHAYKRCKSTTFVDNLTKISIK